MTRLFTDGAEMGDKLNMDPTSSGNWSAVTTSPRSGTYHYAVGNFVGNSYMWKTITTGSEIYVRLAIKISIGDDCDFFRVYSDANLLLTAVVSLSTRKVTVTAASCSVVSSLTVPEAEWRLIEIYYKISDTVGVVELKIDGVNQGTATGDSKTSTYGTYNKVAYKNSGNGYVYMDDLAINNTIGAVDNSWCGDGKIIALTPNATGDVNQLTPSSGSPLNNYQMVDEAPPNTTDYVEGSVVDERDLYNLSASGLTGGTIKRVFVESRSLDTIAVGGLIALTIKTNGTEYDSTDKTLVTAYTAVKGEEYLLNPQTGVAWTISELDSLQAGPKTRTAG